MYSHAVEAMENGLLGGGEGRAVVSNPDRERPKPTRNKRQRPNLRKRVRA